MADPDLSKLHRSELEAIVVDLAKTAERFRRSISNIVQDFDDEGDRVYLGSTNDADELRDLDKALTDSLNELECPWMHGTDLYAKLSTLRARVAELEEGLRRFMQATEDDDMPPGLAQAREQGRSLLTKEADNAG